MKYNLLGILVLCFCLVGCKVPEAVKEADNEAIKTSYTYRKGTQTLLERTIAAYSKESLANIKFRAEVALRMGKPEAEVQKFLEEKKKKLEENVKKVIDKYNALKANYDRGLELRLKISEYLENKDSASSIIGVIVKESLNE